MHFSLLHICVHAGCFSAILWLNAYKYVQKYVSVHKHKCMLSPALAYPNRFIYNYFVYSTQISLLLQPNGSPVSMLGSMKLLVHYHYFLITVFFSYLWRLQSCWTLGILLSPSEKFYLSQEFKICQSPRTCMRVWVMHWVPFNLASGVFLIHIIWTHKFFLAVIYLSL